MIWCVEDDESIREIETYTLNSVGLGGRGFGDAGAFLEALEKETPALVVLDVMLPGMDGVEVLKTMKARREWRSIPVIMATAKGAEFDKVESLDLGADDYLVKPFGMMEMVSRVKAVLRRSGATREAEAPLQCGPVSLNKAAHTVVSCGQKVALTLKEFELLETFLSNPGMVFTREMLLDRIWQQSLGTETRTVDAHIKTLRQKLGEGGRVIETVRGLGYRLNPDD